MGTVIGLSGFQVSRQLRLGAKGTHRPEQAGFTPRDRADLEGWAQSGRTVSLCSSEMGAFAMLYEDSRLWASWGAVRQGAVILIWDCVTLADVGRFPTMTEALAQLVTDDAPVLPHNVVRFAIQPTAMAAGLA